jgi:GNAT superfamily N-acetyltransferase
VEAERPNARPGEEEPEYEKLSALAIVRNAEPRDALAIAQILAQAFPALYRGTFGSHRQARIVALLKALYDAGHLSLTDTRVCEISGRVTAVMILHTGLRIGRKSPRDFWRLLWTRFGLLHAPRMFVGGIMANLMLDRRIPRAADLVYIEALAVAEPYRGQGLGSMLLADAEQWALSHGRSRLALHVLANNLAARRLYERTGFRPWTRGPRQPHEPGSRSTSPWTAIPMVRTLRLEPQDGLDQPRLPEP